MSIKTTILFNLNLVTKRERIVTGTSNFKP